ncbi:hypothetical protein SFRURICE_015467 [Spodoptera frugiperda]|nr:hypothetical protein SFRURICE_015467 [Spodoptera frugiperda]
MKIENTASLVEWSQVLLLDKGSIPGTGKELLGFFRFFENFSVIALSLELYSVYGNRLNPYYMPSPSGIKRRDVAGENHQMTIPTLGESKGFSTFLWSTLRKDPPSLVLRRRIAADASTYQRATHLRFIGDSVLLLRNFRTYEKRPVILCSARESNPRRLVRQSHLRPLDQRGSLEIKPLVGPMDRDPKFGKPWRRDYVKEKIILCLLPPWARRERGSVRLLLTKTTIFYFCSWSRSPGNPLDRPQFRLHENEITDTSVSEVITACLDKSCAGFGLVAQIFTKYAHPLLHRTYNTNSEKWVYIVQRHYVPQYAPLPTPSGIKGEGTFERQSKYNNINNVCLSVSPLVKLFARSKVLHAFTEISEKSPVTLCPTRELNQKPPVWQSLCDNATNEAGFLLCRGCIYKHKSSRTHDTETRNNNLWITLTVAPSGNRTRYTLHGSQLPSHRATLLIFGLIILITRLPCWSSGRVRLPDKGSRVRFLGRVNSSTESGNGNRLTTYYMRLTTYVYCEKWVYIVQWYYVIKIPETKEGYIDLNNLEQRLQQYSSTGQRMIGFFPAASKLTGVLADDVATTLLLHQYGAWSFWDYTLVAPSSAIDMNPTFPGVDEEMVKKDALFFDCEKFVGGVQGPNVVIVKKDVFADTPIYADDVEVLSERIEELKCTKGVRASLVMQLRDAVGLQTIVERQDNISRLRATIEKFSKNPKIAQ